MILVLGATGSIGRLVVDAALAQGLAVRALVRRPGHGLPCPVALGEVTRPETLGPAVEGVDCVILTLGTDGEGPAVKEAVDYGGVGNLLLAVKARRVQIVLMTSVGVTNRACAYNRQSGGHDWKRRAERLVRASGQPHVIVRPGWFDCNKGDQNRLVFGQDDRRHAGNASDGVISRRALARVLVEARLHGPALTFELMAEKGAKQADLGPLFAALTPDGPAALDGALDLPNQPLEAEPERVLADLERIRP